MLVLYKREGCGLCEDFIEMLAEFPLPENISVEIRDVDDEPEWEAYFGEKIPVLMAGECEICRYYFEPPSLQAWLEAQ